MDYETPGSNKKTHKQKHLLDVYHIQVTVYMSVYISSPVPTKQDSSLHLHGPTGSSVQLAIH